MTRAVFVALDLHSPSNPQLDLDADLDLDLDADLDLDLICLRSCNCKRTLISLHLQ